MSQVWKKHFFSYCCHADRVSIAPHYLPKVESKPVKVYSQIISFGLPHASMFYIEAEKDSSVNLSVLIKHLFLHCAFCRPHAQGL